MFQYTLPRLLLGPLLHGVAPLAVDFPTCEFLPQPTRGATSTQGFLQDCRFPSFLLSSVPHARCTWRTRLRFPVAPRPGTSDEDRLKITTVTDRSLKGHGAPTVYLSVVAVGREYGIPNILDRDTRNRLVRHVKPYNTLTLFSCLRFVQNVLFLICSQSIEERRKGGHFYDRILQEINKAHQFEVE